MKRYFYGPVLVLLCAIFSISCASSGDMLKKSDPGMFNEVIGTWYLLEDNGSFDIKKEITFNEDGTVIGSKSFDCWTPETSVGYGSSSPSIKKGVIGIYDSKADDSNMRRKGYQFELVYYNNTADVEYIHQNYRNSKIPVCAYYINYAEKSSKTVHAFVRDKSRLAEMKLSSKENEAAEKAELEKLSKTSIKSHIEFIQKTQNENLKTKATEAVYSLIETKLITYLEKQYPQYKQFLKRPMYLSDGSTLGSFYTIFASPITSINPNTGEKIKATLEKNDDDGTIIDYIWEFQGNKIIISLKPYKDRLSIVGLRSGYKINPSGWELGIPMIFQSFSEYPQLTHVDVELLDK